MKGIEVHQPHLDILDAAIAQRVQRPLPGLDHPLGANGSVELVLDLQQAGGELAIVVAVAKADGLVRRIGLGQRLLQRACVAFEIVIAHGERRLRVALVAQAPHPQRGRVGQVERVLAQTLELCKRALAEKVCRQRRFLSIGRPRERDAVRKVDLFAGVVRGGLAHAAGKKLRLADHEFVVEQRQRLRGNGGDVAPSAARILIRQVEDFEHRVHQAALAVHVDAAPPDLGAVGLAVPDAALHRRENLGRDRRKNGRPADLQIERAARGHHDVAHDLGVETLNREAPEVAIVGVRPESRLVGVLRRHLVRVRRHDQTV